MIRDYDNINKIFLLRKDAFGTKYFYELDVKQSKETCINVCNQEVRQLDSNKTQVKCRRLYDILKKYKKTYINNNILDGAEITFAIEFDDKTVDKIYCKNKMPENFAKVIDIIEEN